MTQNPLFNTISILTVHLSQPTILEALDFVFTGGFGSSHQGSINVAGNGFGSGGGGASVGAGSSPYG